jgi:hypothetical protein
MDVLSRTFYLLVKYLICRIPIVQPSFVNSNHYHRRNRRHCS